MQLVTMRALGTPLLMLTTRELQAVPPTREKRLTRHVGLDCRHKTYPERAQRLVPHHKQELMLRGEQRPLKNVTQPYPLGRKVGSPGTTDIFYRMI